MWDNILYMMMFLVLKEMRVFNDSKAPPKQRVFVFLQDGFGGQNIESYVLDGLKNRVSYLQICKADERVQRNDK